MGSNVGHVGTHETSIYFDAIEDYSELSWLISVGEDIHYLAKSQVRVYHKQNKLYGPNWLLEKEGLI